MRWLALFVTASAAADPLPTIDSQFPPAIRISGAPVKRVAIENTEITWLTVDIASEHWQHPRDLAVDVPAGTRIVGMAFDDGNGSMWGAPRPREPAASDFYHGQTPVLVEANGSTSGEDHLAVRISDGGTLTLALELPAVDRVVTPPRAYVDGKPATSFAPISRATGEGVDAETSLFLDTNQARRGVIIDGFGPAVLWPGAIDKTMIRRQIQYQLPRLRRCWMLLAQRDRVDGAVQLDFTIEPSGTTRDISVVTDPALAEARACLAEVVATIEFPASQQGLVEVHYPITFKLDR